jgi:hypothetical protein
MKKNIKKKHKKKLTLSSATIRILTDGDIVQVCGGGDTFPGAGDPLCKPT